MKMEIRSTRRGIGSFEQWYFSLHPPNIHPLFSLPSLTSAFYRISCHFIPLGAVLYQHHLQFKRNLCSQCCSIKPWLITVRKTDRCEVSHLLWFIQSPQATAKSQQLPLWLLLPNGRRCFSHYRYKLMRLCVRTLKHVVFAGCVLKHWPVLFIGCLNTVLFERGEFNHNHWLCSTTMKGGTGALPPLPTDWSNPYPLINQSTA